MTAPIDRTALIDSGFLRVEQVLRPADLDEVRELLDPLFLRFDSLPSAAAVNLGSSRPGESRIYDINRALSLEPRLRRTSLYRACRDIARQLLGAPTFCCFDHAIYKPAKRSAPTPWHQDQAFVGLPAALHAVHMWVPLQDATAQNGCMWFVPGSHLRGHYQHVPVRGSDHSLEAVGFDASAGVCCPVAAGGLTIHTPMTLHMTGANDSADVRRVWILHFARWGRLGLAQPRNIRSLLARSGRRTVGNRPTS